MRHVEALLGVRAVPGGRHPGMGTRNALVGLGPGCYLEIVGPDPEQPAPHGPRWFGIDGVAGPRLATWAVRVPDLGGAVAAASAAGLELGTPRQGGRDRPDGSRLAWTVTDPFAERAGGVLPFFMDWGDSAHPADSLPGGATLERLDAAHPDAPRIAAIAARLVLPLSVAHGEAPALLATLRTPGGTVTLR